MVEASALRLTGAAQLRVGPRTIELDGLAAVIAARLALQGPQPRALLAAQLWPDAEPARARANLRQRLLRLRQQAGGEWIGGHGTLALVPGLTVDPTDDPQAGELLQGVTLDAQDELSRWLEQAREQQRQRRLGALHSAAQAAEAEQRWPDAIDCVQRQLGIEPLSEACHRALIRLHYLAGDLARAQAAFETLKTLLAREFGQAPSAQTRALMQTVSSALASPPQTLAVASAAGLALLRPPRLVGRAPELAALQEAVAGRRPLLLVGEAGMGKSRLLAEALQHACDAVIVKAQVGDAGVPYSTLARLLCRLFERQPALPQPGVLSRLLPQLRTAVPPPPEGERLLLQDAVQRVLADARLQVVALDDLHFSDAATLELLPALVGDEVLRPAWLFTQRPAEGAAIVQAVREALEEGCGLATRAVSPLDLDQVRELVQDLPLPGLDPAQVAPLLHRHTGGNPLFVLETLKSLQAMPVGAAALPRPLSVASLIDRRLRRLGAAALALARVAAIAGPDFGPELAEAVTGRSAVDLADAWAELEEAQVLRDSAFAHDLVLEAAVRSVPRAIAARLHAAVAQHLQARPPSAGRAARLAAHWQAADDGAAAWPWLLQAADEARDAMRRREEAEFVEQAARLVQALRVAEAPSAASLWLRAYLARECVGGLPAAWPALDQALHAAADERERMQVQVMRAAALIDACDFEQGLQVGQSALQMALHLGDDARAAMVLTKLGSALSMTGQGEEAAALLERHWHVVDRLERPMPANHTERGLLLDNLGRPQQARPLHRRCIDIAQQQGLHSEQIIGTLNLAVSLLDTGEPAAALAQLEAAERLRLAHEGLDGAGVIGWNLLALAERDLAHPRAALGWFERQLALDAEQLPVRAPIDRLSRGWLWLHLGQVARALQDLADDATYAALPAWVAARAWHLRLRLRLRLREANVRQGLDDAGLLQAARAQLAACEARPARDALRIDLALADAGPVGVGDPAASVAALETLRDEARRDGYHGLYAAATWAQAHCAWRAADPAGARALALEAQSRPPDQVPADRWPGEWWHGLWLLWLALGDADAAQAARAEGVAWIHRILQHELPPEFRAAFREAVPAHRELLAGRSGPMADRH